jgi:hypothetical protein
MGGTTCTYDARTLPLLLKKILADESRAESMGLVFDVAQISSKLDKDCQTYYVASVHWGK